MLWLVIRLGSGDMADLLDLLRIYSFKSHPWTGPGCQEVNLIFIKFALGFSL